MYCFGILQWKMYRFTNKIITYKDVLSKIGELPIILASFDKLLMPKVFVNCRQKS